MTDPDLAQRRHFWSTYQPGFRFTAAEPGTPAFFADVEAHRYGLEPDIAEFAAFDAAAGLDVLEGGCGIATDGVNFARRGARYHAVDFSPTAVGLARERFEMEGLGADVRQGTLTELPYPDRSFDLVYSCGVIHHIPQTERVVDEFRRVLRPGGRAVVMVYHRRSLNYHVNIMLLRRPLAASLLLPGAPGAVARLTGEDRAVLEDYRRLLLDRGPRFLLDRQEFLNHNTDGPGNPLSKVYTAAGARRLFAAWTQVETHARFLNLRVYPAGARLARTRLARALEPRLGWHLWIVARR